MKKLQDLSDDAVVGIREAYASGETYTSIAERLDMQVRQVLDICKWRRYKDAGGPKPFNKLRLRGE